MLLKIAFKVNQRNQKRHANITIRKFLKKREGSEKKITHLEKISLAMDLGISLDKLEKQIINERCRNRRMRKKNEGNNVKQEPSANMNKMQLVQKD